MPLGGAGLALAGSSLAGAGLSFMGQQSSAKAMRKAMQDYIDYQNNQRKTFLDQPETTAIKAKLNSYISGDVGYAPDVVDSMKQGVYEDYGKGLADINQNAAGAGLTPGGAYSPGRTDRAVRRLGENIAVNRAQSLRDIKAKNADVALNNQRFAVSALPTYMPGIPSTPTVGPDVFQGLNSVAPFGSTFGPALSSTASSMFMPYIQADAYGPIMEQMMKYMNPGRSTFAAATQDSPWYVNAPGRS